MSSGVNVSVCLSKTDAFTAADLGEVKPAHHNP